jgi:hypothetical protein
MKDGVFTGTNFFLDKTSLQFKLIEGSVKNMGYGLQEMGFLCLDVYNDDIDVFVQSYSRHLPDLLPVEDK